MKYLYLFLLFALTAPCLNAQNKVVREFIREHRQGADNVAFTIPGFLIGLAGDIGELATDDPEEELVFHLAKQFGTIRFVTFDNRDFDVRKDIREVINALENEHGYERWASIRAQSGENVQLTVKMEEKRRKKMDVLEIQEIVAIVSVPDEERTIFAHFRTDLSADELGEIVNQLAAID